MKFLPKIFQSYLTYTVRSFLIFFSVDEKAENHSIFVVAEKSFKHSMMFRDNAIIQ